MEKPPFGAVGGYLSGALRLPLAHLAGAPLLPPPEDRYQDRDLGVVPVGSNHGDEVVPDLGAGAGIRAGASFGAVTTGRGRE